MSSDAQLLLIFLALLDDDPIQESILQHEDGRKIPFGYPSAQGYLEVRQMLTQTSLIHRNKYLNTLSIHNVVLVVARQSMTKDEFSITFQVAISLLTSEWKEDRYWAFGHRLSEWQVADTLFRMLRNWQAIFTSTSPNCHLHRFGCLLPLLLTQACEWIGSMQNSLMLRSMF